MKGKFSSMWRVVIAMVLALTLGLVMAVPASAQTAVWSATEFVETLPDNDGSIETEVTITLSGDTFTVPAGVMTAGVHYNVASVPGGLTLVITGTTTTTANVTLTGTATAHADADSIANLTILFLDAAFTGGDASAVTGVSRSDLEVTFFDPTVMAWSATEFEETLPDNDGSIETVVGLTLTSEAFVVTGAAMTVTTHYTVANVPAGLTVVITGTSATTATVALTGTATNHASANSTTDMGITFLNAAFTGGDASAVAGYTQTALAVTYSDPGSMAWSATEFVEKLPDNDGSIATTVTLTLSNEAFTTPGAAMTVTTHYTAANVPSGLTMVITGTSTTTATVALTGNAAAHASANSTTDMGITFEDAAFTGGNASAVTNYSQTALAVTFSDPVAGSMAWSAAVFLEKLPDNDGSIDTVVVLTLTDEVFTVPAGAMTVTTHYTVANVPTGLTVVITGTSATTANVTLTGTATAHAVTNNITNMGITFLDAAFTSGNATAVTNYSQTALAVNYSDPGSMDWSATEFVEAAANDGSIVTVVVLTLTDEAFEVPGGAMTADVHYTVGNVPGGLTVAITGTSATTANVTLTGNAVLHAIENSIENLTIIFANAAFASGDAGAVTGYSQAALAVTFSGDRSMAWSATEFVEKLPDNDGSIETVVVLTLTNEAFEVPAGAMTVTTHYTVANVPGGLTVAITGTSATTANVTLTGTASSHAVTDNITNMGITFTNAAFTGNVASAVAGYTQTALAVTYSDPGSMAWSATEFVEKLPDNDGSIETVVVLTLTNEAFEVPAGAMTVTTHYTVANVPGGLTVAITGTSATTANVTLTGTATAHAVTDNITNMDITFLDAAFTGGVAAAVAGYSQAALAVTYSDPGSMTWSATVFVEKLPDNDGSIETVVGLTLSNEAFTTPGGAMTGGGADYTAANVPSGLTMVITGTSATTATVALTGNAAAHASANSTTDMGITFEDAAFTSGNASAVTNYSQTALAVTFSDLVYDTLLALNDGWTLFSTDNYIISSGDNTSAWGGTPTLIYRHTGDAYNEYGHDPDSAFAVLEPVEALYVKMPGGGFVGLNYSDAVPFPSSKSLVEGWNLVSSAIVDDAAAVFGPLRYVLIDGQQAIGLSTIVAQGSYNTIGLSDFNEPALTDVHWTALESITLKPFDGYWVYMYSDTTFSVIPD